MIRAGISAWIGKNGTGKTLRMVHELLLPALNRGVPVVANLTVFASVDDAVCPGEHCPCRVLDVDGLDREHWQVREPHPLWRPLESWREILTIERCVLGLDEISSAFGARESGKMPFQVAARLQQLRKAGVRVGWTAPNWKRADVVLREVTQVVTECRGLFPQVRVDDAGESWEENRIFRYRSFDCSDFEEFSLQEATAGRRNRTSGMRPIDTSWYRRKKHPTHLLYSTNQKVEMLDHLDEYGTCVVCGGTRRRPACSCKKGRAGATPDGAPAPPAVEPVPLLGDRQIEDCGHASKQCGCL